MSLWWAVPFAGLLSSIAVVPVVARKFWHAHNGTIAVAWTIALLIPLVATFGAADAIHHVAHTLLAEYAPFVIVLFALFTISGGIRVHGNLRATPARNTALLAVGGCLASIMGTTGAAMLLIRPLLAANDGRRHRAHSVVFFIVIVGNIGGALSPLGDPPLFIGFLKGVDFFWTTRELLWPTLVLMVALLAIFYVVDRALFEREPGRVSKTDKLRVQFDGGFNAVLLAGVVGVVLLSGVWRSDIEVGILGTPLALQAIVRDVLLIVLALASIVFTPKSIRSQNEFAWKPMIEVAKLFAAIFLTMIPLIAILDAGRSGALAEPIALLEGPDRQFNNFALFWIAGTLSAFLDNAPTYLVFFNLASGDATELMGPLAATLKAISMAAVYFGALTYIGNAPNFMVRAIAEDRGVNMPSFFAYTSYTALLLLPLLALLAVFTL